MIKFMSSPAEQLGMYLHLARASQQRQRPLVRDRLLVLAGAIAVEMGLNGIAAYCRQQILDHINRVSFCRGCRHPLPGSVSWSN